MSISAARLCFREASSRHTHWRLQYEILRVVHEFSGSWSWRKDYVFVGSHLQDIRAGCAVGSAQGQATIEAKIKFFNLGEDVADRLLSEKPDISKAEAEAFVRWLLKRGAEMSKEAVNVTESTNPATGEEQK